MPFLRRRRGIGEEDRKGEVKRRGKGRREGEKGKEERGGQDVGLGGMEREQETRGRWRS